MVDEVTMEAALLPLEEKAKYVIELRKQGKTYREIAKALKISPRDIKAILKGEVRKDEIEELKRRLEDLKEIRNEMKKFWSLITATFDIGSCGGCGFAYMKPKFLDSWICPNCSSLRVWKEEYIKKMRPKAPEGYSIQDLYSMVNLLKKLPT